MEKGKKEAVLVKFSTNLKLTVLQWLVNDTLYNIFSYYIAQHEH